MTFLPSNMNNFLATAAATLCAAAISAQSTRVADVGLTLDGGALTVTFGQACGPVPCKPLLAGPIGRGQLRELVHYGAPLTPFAIAIGTPKPICVTVPGIANGLLLGLPPMVIAFGVTGAQLSDLTCTQGMAQMPLKLPGAVPLGFVFHVQSIGLSHSTGQPAFSPALELTVTH